MNYLTKDQRAQLKLHHKKERDGRVRDRIKAVLLYDKGWSIQSIAEALLLSDDAIRIHLNEYALFKKLKPESGRSSEKLSLKQSEQQSEQLEAPLKKYTYLYVKDIVAYVKFTYKISYTIHGLRSWLKRHNFSYKNPSLVPGKADGEQQQKWLSEYAKLKAKLTSDETICFIDGVHPSHNVLTSRKFYN